MSMTGARRGRRRYRQQSALATALDIVGERWTLLLVRELLDGRKRYGQLLDALPGIGTNLLVNRLRDLARAGVVRRTTTGPPSSLVVYELTPVGRGLEAAVRALTEWGETIRAPSGVEGGDHRTASAGARSAGPTRSPSA
jgi:DNA-binding HxlR family transcriptional regulator